MTGVTLRRAARAILIGLWPAALYAATDVHPGAPVSPPRFERAPVIDGRLEDEAWSGAVRLVGFTQIQPGDNIAPSQETTLLIGYDARALYLAFRAEDASGRIRSTVARRDAIVDDDGVGVYLDTFNDRRRAYYLFFNPQGIQADGIYTEGQALPDLTVDIVMESKGVVDARGYTVEVAIPFASLRYARERTSTWGLHVQRFIRRERNEQISWMPISRDRSSLLDQAAPLVGLDGIGLGRPLEIIPTLVGTQVGRRTAQGFEDGRGDGEPGVTVNFGVTPTLNAAFTANPDFAQVEADQLVLTLNQRFPIFYDEKRPFFLEGIDAFQTPVTLVHTRTIADPSYAIKLSGKQGGTTVGALFASDHGIKSALRVKRDVRRDSMIGATATIFEDGSRHSELFSADARLRVNDQTVFTAQLGGSSARMPFRDPEAVGGASRERHGAGLTYYGRLERRTRRTVIAGTAAGSSPDFRADLGFFRRVNVNSVALQTTYNAEPRPDARLISWTLTNVTNVQWDWQGRANYVYVYPQARLNFRRQTYVQLLTFRDYERIFEEEFGARREPDRAGAFAGDSERSTSYEGFILSGGSAPSEALSWSATVARTWDFFDYDFGAGPKFPRVSPAALADPDAPLDPGPSRSSSIGGDITWRPIDPLRTSVEVSRNTLVRNDNGRTAYDATLLSWRTTYQVTRFAFLRLRTDWDSARAALRGQYLVGWTPNPGTAVYAGYTEEATVNGIDPYGVDLLGAAHLRGYQRQTRTVFVKVSYLFRRLV